MDKKLADSFLEEAHAYNEYLGKNGLLWKPTDEEHEKYLETLDMFSDGMMGYLHIPAIGCRLPVYHGTDESVLQIGAGHMEGSSFPVGGVNSHCVVSGHRGLVSARLFTGLDKVREGDVFVFHVLNESIYYKVEHIQTVLPEETQMLRIEQGEDLCTLVTCTPYGVNTHRLLITGNRIDEEEVKTTVTETNEKGGIRMQPEAILKWLGLSIFVLLFFISSGRSVKAETVEKNALGKDDVFLFNVEIEYPVIGTEFTLFRGDETEPIQVQTIAADQKAVFSQVEPGNYRITGKAATIDSWVYLPVESKVNIPILHSSGLKRIRIKPKYEKVPVDMEIPELPKEEDRKEDIIATDLPKTGQLWWPTMLLTISGVCLMAAGWIGRIR